MLKDECRKREARIELRFCGEVLHTLGQNGHASAGSRRTGYVPGWVVSGATLG